jgi:protein-tyrosine phosphatase
MTAIPSTIALICTANRCRSPMAHAIAVAEMARRALPIQVYSAGLMDSAGWPPMAEAVLVCQAHQTPIPNPGATFVGDLPLDTIAHFLVMEPRHATRLTATHGITPARIALLSQFDPDQRGPTIQDPLNEGLAAFEACYQRLRDCLTHYLETIAPVARP